MLYSSVSPSDMTMVPLHSTYEVMSAIGAGNMVKDDSGFIFDNGINRGSVISFAGGFLLKGCPIDTFFGSSLTTDEAKALIGIAPVLQSYGYTSCLTQAQNVLGSVLPPQGIGVPIPLTLPAPVLLSPTSGTSDAGGQLSVPVTINTAPSIPGALPPGTAAGPQFGGTCLKNAYRFIYATGGGFATGANRVGCSQTNSANCDPQFLPTLHSAILYAVQHGEIPYKVDTAQEPWDLIACNIPIDPGKIYNADGSLGGGSSSILLLLAAVLVGYAVTRRGGQ